MPLFRPGGGTLRFARCTRYPSLVPAFSKTGFDLLVLQHRSLATSRAEGVTGVMEQDGRDSVLAADTSAPVAADSASDSVDLTSLSPAELIARINDLESRLKSTTTRLSALSDPRTKDVADNEAKSNNHASPIPNPPLRAKPKKSVRPMDFSRYNTRHIALKFAYLGQRYNGFEHANGTIPAKPTIEEVLWKALRKARLIPTDVPEGCDGTFEVVYGEQARWKFYDKGKVRLEIDWTGLRYSKCGRTDRGVSAFGQVVAITVRSNRPKNVKGNDGEVAEEMDNSHGVTGNQQIVFDDTKDELPYITILNSILPPDIRILAWSPDPDGSFNARFNCRERRYKYFFTNPAFCPTPGPVGLRHADRSEAPGREGWLDIEAMRKAAKKLEGLHDFRNFCKIDSSQQMSSCDRRITFADIEELPAGFGVSRFVTDTNLNQHGSTSDIVNETAPAETGLLSPKVYAFAVHGSAFLWHQVRCMVAILFLVGQGLEKPEIVDDLFDIARNPGRPQYEMANDAPLVLWDCLFAEDKSTSEGVLQWIHAGDEVNVSAFTRNGDSPFNGNSGIGGLVNGLWSLWREAKMQETLTAGLLMLGLNQGDGSSLAKSGYWKGTDTRNRSQRVFNGSNSGRTVGGYIPVMEKPRLTTLEEANTKFRIGRLARRNLKKAQISLDE